MSHKVEDLGPDRNGPPGSHIYRVTDTCRHCGSQYTYNETQHCGAPFLVGRDGCGCPEHLKFMEDWERETAKWNAEQQRLWQKACDEGTA